MPLFDQHTHKLPSLPGSALVNLSMDTILHPDTFAPEPGHIYSAGIFPLFDGDWEQAFRGVRQLASLPQITTIGECGLDKRNMSLWELQTHFFEEQILLAGRLRKPLVIHCVRAWAELLRLHSLHPGKERRVIHGFRGKPLLAQQLLNAGFYLSFGPLFNVKSFQLCPASKRLIETDNSNYTIEEVAKQQSTAVL